MTPQTTKTSRSSGVYTPDIELPPPDSRDAWWRALARPTELATAVALLLAALAFLGIRVHSPGDAQAATDVRVARLEKRVDSLYDSVRLTNFMQCVAFRQDHPELLPPDCAPIIATRAKAAP